MNAAGLMASVVTRLIVQMRAGVKSWEMPWRNFGASGWPTNAVTGRRYRGGNAVWLMFAAEAAGYPTSRWATYKQWADVGAQVRRGERSFGCVYWHVAPIDPISDPDDQPNEPLESAGRRPMWARTFNVFNAAQVDGDPNPNPTAPATTTLQREASAEAFFGNVPADVAWGAGNPCYRPTTDVVVMPAFDAFHTAADAYATLSHELGHWTGHPDRLNRSFGARFGDHAYAAEELVAELSAAFTCAIVGIDTVARTDHAGYLAHWCDLLAEQPATLWTVAAKAQAATDLLASYQPATADNPTAGEPMSQV